MSSGFLPRKLLQGNLILCQFIVMVMTHSTDHENMAGAFEYPEEIYDQRRVEYIEDLMVQESTQTTRTLPHTLLPETPAKASIRTTIKDYTAVEYEFQLRSHLWECDRPWFWRSFQCVALDIRHRRYTPRLKRNAVIATIIVGIVLLITCGASLCTYCYFRLKFALLFQSYRKIGEKYTKFQRPGVIELPDGELRYYQSSREEYEALVDLMEVMATVD